MSKLGLKDSFVTFSELDTLEDTLSVYLLGSLSYVL